jgi:hypothetical protein
MNKRRILILFAASLFGALAWLSVSMGERYQVTLTAPLAVEDVPAGYAIRTPVPRTIQLRYRGDGWRLALLQLGADANLTMTFTALRPAGELPGRTDSSAAALRNLTPSGRVITHLDISERAPARAGVELTDVTPDSIFLGLDRYEERTVPLQVDISTSFREGYGQVGGATISPESVTVGGAASIVRTIASWPTVRRDFKDLRTPVEADVALAQSPLLLLVLSTTTTHISLNVEPFAEKVLNGISVEGKGIPGNREVIFIPPRVDIVARGGIKQLANLAPSDFQVRVQYTTIVADTTGFIDPNISGPDGIQVVTKRPDRVQYIVRKRL